MLYSFIHLFKSLISFVSILMSTSDWTNLNLISSYPILINQTKIHQKSLSMIQNCTYCKKSWEITDFEQKFRTYQLTEDKKSKYPRVSKQGLWVMRKIRQAPPGDAALLAHISRIRSMEPSEGDATENRSLRGLHTSTSAASCSNGSAGAQTKRTHLHT